LLSELYEEWFGHWLNFLTEIKTLCNEIGQAPQYVPGGVVVSVHDFGNITFESFCDMWKGQQLKESWFFSVEVVSGDRRETFMFSFDKDVDKMLSEPNVKVPPIALFVARSVGNEYRRLSTEAVALRCFRVIGGQIQAFSAEGPILKGETTRVMNMFLAEAIFDYLMPELPG
jgi:hypothetical protein